MARPTRSTTGGERTPIGAPVSFEPLSPQTQRYDLGSPGHHRQARPRQGGQVSQGEIRDLFRGDTLLAREFDGAEQSDDAEIALIQSVDELEAASGAQRSIL